MDGNPRAIVLEHLGSCYLVIEAGPQFLGDQAPNIVKRSGLTASQMIASIMSQTCYRFGSLEGRFHGTVMNDMMPLCEADYWREQPEHDVRTWRQEGAFFSFDPYTIGDLMLVLRCGVAAAYLHNPNSTAIRMNQGGDGLWVENPPDGVRAYIEGLLEAYDIPVESDPELLNYIDRDGHLTY